MSWLNLNDSLNSLKGQISNFANNVLADDDQQKDEGTSNGEIQELQKICAQQQEEINNLRKLNADLSLENKNVSMISNNDFNPPDDNWSWNLSGPTNSDTTRTDEIIADLRKTINELRNEKQELVSSLELLDSDYQLNTERLVSMKNKLQDEYNELEDEYTKVKENIQTLKQSKMETRKELEDLKTKYQELLEKSPAPSDETKKDETCIKCEHLLKQNQKFTAEIETLKNETTILNSNINTLRKVLDDTKTSNDDEFVKMEEKLKCCESENKILISELQKANKSVVEFEKKSEIDAENCRKLAIILEGYEHQVSSLKQELSLKDTNLHNTEEVAKLKKELEEVQKQLQWTLSEKEHTHMKYINILTDNVKKYVDSNKPSDNFRSPTNEIDPQVSEFSHQVESILNILLDLKSKCESLENELYNVREEKTNMLSEKNHEIEKLLQNSEILSQEVITKSQTIKDYENECNELIKNNDMLISELEIFKNNSGLQTISESNEDNLLLLESQLENANKKIADLESIIAQYESGEMKDGSPTVDEISEQYVTKNYYQQLSHDFDQSKEENSSLMAEIEKCEQSRIVTAEEKEKLNLQLERMKTDLENTEYQYTEININLETLKDEVQNQRKQIEELNEEKLSLEKQNVVCERHNEDIRSECNVVREKLLLEEDNRKQLESQIRNLTEKLQNAKMCETSLKLQYDTISKELVGMTEAKCMVENSFKHSLDNFAHYQDDLLKLQDENEKLKNLVVDLEAKLENNTKKLPEEITEVHFEKINIENNSEELSSLNNDLQSTTPFEQSILEQLKHENLDLLNQVDELKLMYASVIEEKDSLQSEITRLSNEHLNCRRSINALEKTIEELGATKNELTNVIIIKHKENVTYHNEIQRLSQILNAEVEKTRNLETELQAVKAAATHETDIQKKDEEIDKLTDQNNFLRQKCEVLAENLLQEQNKVQQILSEHNGPSEREQTLSKKLDRLQTHLIEVEEHYTQELLRSEERNAELQAKVNEIEQREKNSSTMYTSVSIRANQHVETLQHQLQLITNQRDELRKKISDAEDHSNKQEAALANLQFVLEQFQKDKENDVQKETERIRRQMNTEKRVQEDLKREIANLQSQLEETKHGLLAASRLSDQLEQSKKLVTTLKSEVSQLKEKLQKNEDQLHNLSSQSDGKVDKSLIKNLVIGFASTNNSLSKDQVQILKIIATVLDFNQQDHDKVNLNKPQQGWLSSFLNPQTSQGMSQETLSQAFVKFLENESKPRLVPSLLSNNNGETPQSRKSSVTVPRQSPSILSEVVLPTFADFAQNRNSSSILKDVLKDNS